MDDTEILDPSNKQKIDITGFTILLSSGDFDFLWYLLYFLTMKAGTLNFHFI